MAEFILGNAMRKLARRNRPLRQLLWRLDFALIWLLVKCFRALPIDTASRCGERVGAWIGPKLRKKTAIFRDNLAVALPELAPAEREKLIVQAWGRAGRVLAEYTHLDTILREEDRLEIVIQEPIETYTNPSVPFIGVAAHLANWEVACLALARMGIPNATLYSPPSNPLLDTMLLESRGALDCQLLPRQNSARLLLRALKKGRSAAMIIDRRVDDGRPVPFFGRDKLSTLIPAKLALKHRCHLVPARVERLRDARFRVTLHAPIRPGDSSADETAQALDMTRQVHALFEAWIRQQPQDWFC
ncbi:MAG: hypothetical protein KDI01_07520, partial [Halioglobus sp.]|nr:hypothetical protein [Halioglobus sp.]